MKRLTLTAYPNLGTGHFIYELNTDEPCGTMSETLDGH